MGEVLVLTPYGIAHVGEYLSRLRYRDFWEAIAEKYDLSDLVNLTQGEGSHASRRQGFQPSPYADMVEEQLRDEQRPGGFSRPPKKHAIDWKGGIMTPTGFVSFKELAERYAPPRGLATDVDQSKFPYIRGETKKAFEHRMQVKEEIQNVYFWKEYLGVRAKQLFHDPLVGGVDLYGRKRLIELFSSTCIYGLGYYGEPLGTKCPNHLEPFERTPKYLLCKEHRPKRRNKDRPVAIEASPVAQNAMVAN